MVAQEHTAGKFRDSQRVAIAPPELLNVLARSWAVYGARHVVTLAPLCSVIRMFLICRD